MHESYKKPFGMSHDIALLKLSTPAQLNNRVALACLPDKSVDLPIDDISKRCWITGKYFTLMFLFQVSWQELCPEGKSMLLN